MSFRISEERFNNTFTSHFTDTMFICKCRPTGWPKKVSHYQMIQKSYEIVLKPVNKIRFIRQINVSIKHYNIIPWY